MAIKITHQFESILRGCTIRFVQVDVYNVIDMAMDVYSKIIETSWLYNLDPIVKKILGRTSQRYDIKCCK